MFLHSLPLFYCCCVHKPLSFLVLLVNLTDPLPHYLSGIWMRCWPHFWWSLQYSVSPMWCPKSGAHLLWTYEIFRSWRDCLMREADNHKQGIKFNKQHPIISDKYNCQLCVDESQTCSQLLHFPLLTLSTLIIGRVRRSLLYPSSFLLFLTKIWIHSQSSNISFVLDYSSH